MKATNAVVTIISINSLNLLNYFWSIAVESAFEKGTMYCRFGGYHVDAKFSRTTADSIMKCAVLCQKIGKQLDNFS